MAKKSAADNMDHSLEQFFDAFFKLDRQGRFITLGGKTAELFNSTADDLHGQRLWERFPQMTGGEFERGIHAAQEQGAFKRISGPLLPGAGWVEITLRPVADGIECYVRDVSSYRQAQAGPTHDENSRIIFDALLDHIPEGIIIADAAARSGEYPFLVVSRYGADILGVPRERLLGATLADLLERVQFMPPGSDTPDSPQEHPLTRFIEHGERVEDLEYEMVNAKGEHIPISIKGGPIRVQQGRIIAGIFSWMNTSERNNQKQMLEHYALRLEQSNRDLESFAYSAAHDLQEPLRKVKGFSELLERKYRDQIDQEGQDLLERIRGAAMRMQDMMTDLLEYSRLSMRDTERGPVDLGLVLKAVLVDLDQRIISTAAQVEVGDLPVVDANPVRMQQLFLNLVGNALKFHQHDVPPRVRIYASGQVQRSGQTWVQIAVEDNGIGFDEQNLERILQPFQRLHGRGEYEGRGIGLSICVRIVEQLGGTLTANSQPGQGSTFRVTLPKSKEE
jgi:signal transduction histidine kinase